MVINSEMGDETKIEEEIPTNNGGLTLNAPRKYKLVIRPIITFTYIHLASFYGIYLCFTKAKWSTILFNYLMFLASDIGITAGAHRLWSHKSYKVNLPLEILIMLFNTVAFQNTAFSWVRDHRQHHKYCDTDGDPHNARRGFFYSHIGWLLTRKSDEVMRCGKTIDMSDMYNNPVVMFQRKYAFPLITIFCFVLPTVLPMYWFGETFSTAWHLNMLRYGLTLNVIWLVNSASHLWGYKPYDKAILPTENYSVSVLSLGEGYHNYHHVFPWDYKAGEFGRINVTAWFIDFFAKIGWAYDLKTASDYTVRTRAMKTGDGTDYLMFMLAVIGITAGAHRLWSHRSYKVNMPLEIIIMLFSSVASQYSAFYWVRDHRQHHKYCDTDGDPHNARRGLFYSHIGWVLTMESDEVKRCAKTIDMSDMYNNPVVMFQKKYVVPLFIIFSYVLPTVLPIYWFGETYTTAWHLNMLRYGFSLNVIFLINSAAHYWGYKPYDKTILPTENFCVSLLNLGEGYHNYHHAFPWDYKAGEYGKINVTTWFIDFFAKIGWAYDLKTASDNVVKNRAMKTGDGTYVQDKGEDVNNE